MRNGICYVVGAGENYGLDFQPATGDFVITADAGLCYLEEQGIRADLVIGDFDTLKCVPEHPNTIGLSEEKDDTDTLAAVREGIRAGYTCFHIYCGTGGRIDHTMANLQVLAYFPLTICVVSYLIMAPSLRQSPIAGFVLRKSNAGIYPYFPVPKKRRE